MEDNWERRVLERLATDGLREQRRSDDDTDKPVRRAALTEVKRKDRQQRSDSRAGHEDTRDDSKKSRTALRLGHPRSLSVRRL